MIRSEKSDDRQANRKNTTAPPCIRAEDAAEETEG
jgi:hypothetical protein